MTTESWIFFLFMVMLALGMLRLAMLEGEDD